MMAINLFATIRQGKAVTAEVEVTRFEERGPGFWRLIFSAPVIFSALIVGATVLLGAAGILTGIVALVLLEVLVVALIVSFGARRQGKSWHEMVEGNAAAFTVLTLVAILIGGLVEIIPTVMVRRNVPDEAIAAAADSNGVKLAAAYDFVQQPYSPLELEGRDIYVREGCYLCHSQMIRPFRHETLRYGEYSRATEFIYDTPFQWGSKRTGPDLARVGGKYADLWHYQHLKDARSTSPGSNMPVYAFLLEGEVDLEHTADKMRVLRRLGVPYTDEQIRDAAAIALGQGRLIAGRLAEQSVQIDPRAEMVAVIAYLQRMGRGPQPIEDPSVELSTREGN
jgi:cytochrome c oxidase cbb3-type subunit I/II